MTAYFLSFLLKLGYGIKLDTLPRQRKPFILMTNHTTEVDMFHSASSVPRNFLYFIAWES